MDELFGLSRRWRILSNYGNYRIKSLNTDHGLIMKIVDKLDSLLMEERVYKVEYKNPKLIIDLRTDQNHTTIIEQLLELD